MLDRFVIVLKNVGYVSGYLRYYCCYDESQKVSQIVGRLKN